MPISAFRRFRRSRICAWIVTSRAVVGSSAMRSFGLQRERHRDHHALCHAARELMDVGSQAALGFRNADHAQQLDCPLLPPSFVKVRVQHERLAQLPSDRMHAD